MSAKAPSDSEADDDYIIYVKLPDGKTITLDVSASDTIGNVKAHIRGKEGSPSKHQRLIFASSDLENANTLSSYGIKDGDSLQLLIEGDGGGKRAETSFALRVQR